MKEPLIFIILISLLLISCSREMSKEKAVDLSIEESQHKKEYNRGLIEGKKRAIEEIKSGNMTIYTIGKTDHRVTHDKETGLKRYNLGCMIQEYENGLYDGHNQKILNYIQDNKP